MTRPRPYLLHMALFVLAVLLVCVLVFASLARFFLGNPAVNGTIVGIMLAGTIYIFRQVMLLNPEVSWIERYRRNQAQPSRSRPPRLIAPIVQMLAERKSGRVSLSATSMRTLLDGIATRLEETRETSRYLIGLLICLGLLGTFYGLLETVGTVGDVLGALSFGGSADVTGAFNQLKTGLQSPLEGMRTAFSASLFGLAGFLVLGFLDLQAGLAQNRFYNELEEWLASFTRLAGGGGFAEGGDTPVPAYIQALLEQTADSLESLQRILGRGEESRITANANIVSLTERLGALTEQMRTEQTLLVRLAEGQMELRPVLQRLADSGSQRSPVQEESRNHLRNIEVHLARLYEDVSQGRSSAVQEIRSEIRLLARTIAALAEEAEH